MKSLLEESGRGENYFLLQNEDFFANIERAEMSIATEEHISI